MRRIFVVAHPRDAALELERGVLSLGHAVAGSVTTGEEAIARVAASPPDLVLLDVALGGAIDGIEAAAAMRARVDVPVVFVTARADDETLRRAKAVGPLGYVVKPCSDRQLRGAIEIALHLHETDHASRRDALLRAIVDGTTDSVCVKDLACRYLLANEACARRLTTPLDRLLGHDDGELLPASRARFLMENDLEVMRRREPVTVEEVLDVDGEERIWQSTKSPYFDASGRLGGVICISRDITDMKRLEQELRAAVEARDEFLQVASHELKTPLTPLQLQLETLQRAVERAGLRDAQVNARVEMAARQTRRLALLVQSLLDVSAIRAGRFVLQPDDFDLAGLVHETVERFRPEAARVGSTLLVDVEAPLAGRWDRLRLDQVLSNLIANAIKYGAGKPIEVTLRGDDGTVRLTVVDHGIGIPEEARERIFGRYERAASLRHFGGLGLGLFIARRIVEAHGGSVVAQSHEGNGSTFTVVLPRRVPLRPRDEGRVPA